ncbi:hypothetical protein JOE59_001999 [Agromyces cerinus]|uniref:hypothetical protein n=1 Tax=Agromyces cerinus TaxID=33878 RepID=UPI00195B1028|nr:hypothetical protein [Agromyces cerinus]MBM7831294.1 hypothetical protein [Agromyces cerinus]
MTRIPSLAAALLAAVTIPLLLSACVAGASSTPNEHATSSPATTAASESEPTPEPAAPVEVDPSLYLEEYVPGVVFGVGSGAVNCQLQEPSGDPAVVAWGCAVFLDQEWQWEDTAFAEYCAQLEELEELGCRNGLVVHGEEAPAPRRNTDADFGGVQASHVLAAGERITVGDVSCEPVGDGVRCEDVSSGHGFTLSVAAIDAW